MVELTDPPTMEHGFVQGRFVTAVADSLNDEDRYPDLRGISGNVRFTAAQPVNLVSAGTPATVVQQPVVLPLNSDGWLVDAHSKDDPARTPGVWLAVGRYTVQTIFPSATPVPQFSIEVTADHTKVNPLNLTLAAPIILPPRAVEVTRVIDRQLAVAAAEAAQESAQAADSSSRSASSSAAAAAASAADAEAAREATEALGITVDTTAGELIRVGSRVIKYSSGSRRLHPGHPFHDAISGAEGLEIADGILSMSREMNVVEVSIPVIKTTSSSVTVPVAWPQGFAPALSGQQIGYNSQLEVIRVWTTNNSLVFQGPAAGPAFTVSMRFLVSSNLPNSLPGSPA